MQYKALPWLRVCTFGLGAQSANIWIRDWNVRNAIIEVLVLRNPRTCPTPLVWWHLFGDVIMKMAILHWCASIEDEGIAFHLLLTESCGLVFPHIDMKRE